MLNLFLIFCCSLNLYTSTSKISLVIFNGNIVTGEDYEECSFGIILINNDGKIEDIIKSNLTTSFIMKQKYPKVKLIDAKGKLVIPGGIDPHVHLETPDVNNGVITADNFYTGTLAALCGGTTTIIDNVEPNIEQEETMIKALNYRNYIASTQSVLDYSFHMSFNFIYNRYDI